MPAYRNHTVLEIAWGMKAFFTLAVGVTRGEVPDPGALKSRLAEAHSRIDRQNQRIQQLQGSISANDKQAALSDDAGFRVGSDKINPENIVWILGSPRTGST